MSMAGIRLGHGWRAQFVDDEKRVMLTKPSSVRRSTLCMQWDPLFMKRIDPVTGLPMLDSYDKLPPDSLAKLKDLCAERWGQ